MLQITEFTQAALTSVTNRIEKHGDDDKPAVTLMVEITAPNTLLDTIDPGLRHALYKAKPDSEPELPGVEQSTPVLRTNCIDSVALTVAHEGWSLHLDDGIDETDPIIFGSVKVDKLKVDAKQGGSIVLKLRMGTSDVDADRLGMLGMHNGQDIWMKLLPPEKPAAGATEATGAEIDGSVGHPGAAGQGLLLDSGESGGEGGDDSTGEGDGLGGFADDLRREGGSDADPESRLDAALAAGAADGTSAAQLSKDKLDASGRSPFPSGGAKSDEQVAAEREQAELEAGMAKSLENAGVTPKGARRRGKAGGVGAVE